MDNFSEADRVYLSDCVCNLEDGLKKSKINFSESYKGWNFTETGKNRQQTPENVIADQKMTKSVSNFNLQDLGASLESESDAWEKKN